MLGTYCVKFGVLKCISYKERHMCGRMPVCRWLNVCAQNVGHIFIFKFRYFVSKSCHGIPLSIEIDNENTCVCCSVVLERNLCLTLQIFVATESFFFWGGGAIKNCRFLPWLTVRVFFPAVWCHSRAVELSWRNFLLDIRGYVCVYQSVSAWKPGNVF